MNHEEKKKEGCVHFTVAVPMIQVNGGVPRGTQNRIGEATVRVFPIFEVVAYDPVNERSAGENMLKRQTSDAKCCRKSGPSRPTRGCK